MQARWDRGTVLVTGAAEEARALPGFLWDGRVGAWRCPAWRWPEARRARPDLPDLSALPARADCPAEPELRPYQQAAVAAWEAAGRRGILVLPTGSGKTRTALAAIARARVRALVVVPTRVLQHQWVDAARAAGFGAVGEWGDGIRAEQALTIATDAAARRAMDWLGARFELLIIDEVHHSGGQRDETLALSLAPWRLGLTATPVEDPERADRLAALVGGVVFRASVADLSGEWLAPFERIRIELPLDRRERLAYDAARAQWQPVVRGFFDANPAADWKEFNAAAMRSEAGRRALAAVRECRALVQCTAAKRRVLGELLTRHAAERTLVFAADNASVYAIARDRLVHPVTCEIGSRERADVLERFGQGSLRALVSARVLDEGVDVPEAEVAIVVGRTHGGRQFVQRVGRVLRPTPEKTARVYELLAAGTHEIRTAARHGRHLDGV